MSVNDFCISAKSISLGDMVTHYHIAYSVLACPAQRHDEQGAALARIAEAITPEEEGVWGAFPNCDSGTYTFLINYLPYVDFDGMEHRNSTVIADERDLKYATAYVIGPICIERPAGDRIRGRPSA